MRAPAPYRAAPGRLQNTSGNARLWTTSPIRTAPTVLPPGRCSSLTATSYRPLAAATPVCVRHAGLVADNNWYSTRCVFEFHGLAETPTYEERVTLWHAPDFETAIALSEGDAEDYAADLCTFTGLIQAFQLYDVPGHGAEVFSLMRTSALSAREYLDTFFDTGDERMGQSDAPASR
jgi:hypothetical protein